MKNLVVTGCSYLPSKYSLVIPLVLVKVMFYISYKLGVFLKESIFYIPHFL